MASKKGKAEVNVLLGTRKGAFILQSDHKRRTWKMKGPFLQSSPVFHMAFDPRDGKTIYAAVNSGHFGPTVQRSRNFGKTWENAEKPPRFTESSGLKVENVWHVEPGLADEPDTVYAGVAPGALFRSEDGGSSWEMNQGLNNHPSRAEWQPGAGGLCLHSIVLDPSRPKRMYVGISAVGVFKSEDAGETWNVKNKNVRADFAPIKYPEFGQCVHKLVMDTKKPDNLYQQNHCGVYRTSDAAESWVEISKGLPSTFGFPMAIHPHDSERFYVMPEEGDFFRVMANKEFAVYETENAGRTWMKRTKGMPKEKAYVGSYREGLATDQLDPVGVYAATRMGHLFHSADEGKSWRLIAQWLPPIYSVSTATIT
jgi:photosystem II stability/assembly factor-like uncharacterized protein